MSFLDTALSNTVGVLWRGATGTVDPWTKNNQVAAETETMVQAGADPATAAAQAQADVTGALKSQKADPTDAQNGLASSVNQAKNYIIIAVVVIAAIYLGGKYLEGGRQ